MSCQASLAVPSPSCTGLGPCLITPEELLKLARVSSGINIAVGEPGQGMLVNELALLLLRFDDRLSSNVP